MTIYKGYNQAVTERLARQEAVARARETLDEKTKAQADVEGQLKALKERTDAAAKKRDGFRSKITQCQAQAQELQSRMKAAEQKRSDCQRELAALKGLFSGRRRRKLEDLLSQQSASLDDMQRRETELKTMIAHYQQQISALETQLHEGEEEGRQLSLYALALAQETENARENLRASIYECANACRNVSAYDMAFALFDRIRGYRDVDSIIENDDNISAAATAREAYLAQFEVGKTVTFGHYEQDNNTSNGQEAIEWIVLENDGETATLISKYALDAKPYNKQVVDISWENCTLRKWLNSDFLNAAFTADEQSKLVTTTVTADRNPSYSTNTNPGNDTQERVWLLSIPEANRYFASDDARKCTPTDYAIAQGTSTTSGSYKVDGRATCWWWLRSPGYSQYFAANVDYDGYVYDGGGCVNLIDLAVRPVVRFAL